MATLIKQRAVVADTWQTLQLAEGDTPDTVALPAGPSIFPLAVWQARKAEILARQQPVGVVLAASEEAAALADDLAQIALVAVDFPKFTDGRGFTTARLLRERFAFGGEIRAVGDVLVDQLFFMTRVGFDAYALRDDQKVESALAAFETFSEAYQTGVDRKEPLFRRRAA